MRMAFCGVTLKPCSPVSATLACSGGTRVPGSQEGRGGLPPNAVPLPGVAVRGSPLACSNFRPSPQQRRIIQAIQHQAGLAGCKAFGAQQVTAKRKRAGAPPPTCISVSNSTNAMPGLAGTVVTSLQPAGAVGGQRAVGGRLTEGGCAQPAGCMGRSSQHPRLACRAAHPCWCCKAAGVHPNSGL